MRSNQRQISFRKTSVACWCRKLENLTPGDRSLDMPSCVRRKSYPHHLQMELLVMICSLIGRVVSMQAKSCTIFYPLTTSIQAAFGLLEGRILPFRIEVVTTKDPAIKGKLCNLLHSTKCVSILTGFALCCFELIITKGYHNQMFNR